MSEKKIIELQIIKGDQNIFTTDNTYLIPLYQREYAWREVQIKQLIDDINEVDVDKNYYIGSLIVHNRGNNNLEIIDGQQRLTTLFLLLNCLKVKTKVSLIFECRDRSNDTLKNITDIIKDPSNLEEKKIERNIQNGVNIIKDCFKNFFNDNQIEAFKEKLSRVILYQITVPPHTDLNRYFEIMNTRGEQLAQHDILKAHLMESLNPEEFERFALIWDACSDMNGYVQMHFSPEDRKDLFTRSWNEMPKVNTIKKYLSNQGNNSSPAQGGKIEDIINSKPVASVDGINERDERVRFESIIDFPHFLMHTLRVFIAHKGLENPLDQQLDDKKLKDDFDKIVKKSYPNNKADFSREFICTLLQTRFLFDQFIIKRETPNGSEDGEWSLKTLQVSRSGKNPTAYYNVTTIGKNCPTEECLMMQAALRVSYTSPKEMHWITNLLTELTRKIAQNSSTNSINWSGEDFLKFTESIAAKRVQEHMQGIDWAKKGTATPHIIFNYLDYLLWKQDYQKTQTKREFNDFTFEFRNSVEHWYPQNPSSDSFSRWDYVKGHHETVDCFGNLCLVQRNVNSKFSNLDPKSKKTTYKDFIAKGSLKLREMSKILDNCTAEEWCTKNCKAHEEAMIKILNDDLTSKGLIPTTN